MGVPTLARLLDPVTGAPRDWDAWERWLIRTRRRSRRGAEVRGAPDEIAPWLARVAATPLHRLTHLEAELASTGIATAALARIAQAIHQRRTPRPTHRADPRQLAFSFEGDPTGTG